MSTHRPNFTIELKGEPDAWMGSMQTFLEGNGYDVSLESPQGELWVERGKPGNGWWSSDMSELHTKLRVFVRDEALHLEYTVDVRGQHMTKEDRAYWTREVAAGRDHLEGGALVDVRTREGERASQRFRQTLSQGFMGALLVGGLCVMLVLVLHRLGFLRL